MNSYFFLIRILHLYKCECRLYIDGICTNCEGTGIRHVKKVIDILTSHHALALLRVRTYD